MPLDSVPVGANQRQIIVIGDPSTASSQLSVGQYHLSDGQSLTSTFGLLVGNIVLVKNASGTFDVARSASGTTGVMAVNAEGTKASYSAGVVAFTPAATATDFFQIVGSATKTVRILRVRITGIATSAASNDVQLIKRTVANTGGTTASVTVAQYDSNDAAASAAVNTYSVNPTGLGTGVTVRSEKLNLGAAGSAGAVAWHFGSRAARAMVLRGTAQSLVLNWNGAAVPAGTSLNIDVEFTEE